MERCTLKEHGFVGAYYPGTRARNKAVIAVGGASCDEKTSVAMCRYLREAGYNVLVLGFYLWDGLPKEMVSIPVDYVERAVKWLKQEKGVDGVAMTAASTGADVPYSPWELTDQGMGKIIVSTMRDRRYGLKRLYRYGYDHNPVTEESRIRVENMHADVLFLAAKDDDAWPSDEAVPRMVKVLREADYPYRVEYHIYEKASHALTDGLDEMGGYAKWALRHLLPAEKKYPRECEAARQDSFRRVLRFLDEWEP